MIANNTDEISILVFCGKVIWSVIASYTWQNNAKGQLWGLIKVVAFELTPIMKIISISWAFAHGQMPQDTSMIIQYWIR